MSDIREKMLQRFLKYVAFDTESSDDATTVPTTQGQMLFARYLKEELESMGLDEVVLDEKGYIYATLPSNSARELPVIGFIAHLDTSPDMSGKNVKPRVVDYSGGDIVLDEKGAIILSQQDFPELSAYKGHVLVVTDGHTLLGADDKAGVAEIISAIDYLQTHPEIEHGKVRIAFNPDEEIGRGAHNFNVSLFGCDWAYTVDGSAEGEIEFENFNAGSANFSIQGRNVHPGYAKGKMLNALRVYTRQKTILCFDVHAFEQAIAIRVTYLEDFKETIYGIVLGAHEDKILVGFMHNGKFETRDIYFNDYIENKVKIDLLYKDAFETNDSLTTAINKCNKALEDKPEIDFSDVENEKDTDII